MGELSLVGTSRNQVSTVDIQIKRSVLSVSNSKVFSSDLIKSIEWLNLDLVKLFLFLVGSI